MTGVFIRSGHRHTDRDGPLKTKGEGTFNYIYSFANGLSYLPEKVFLSFGMNGGATPNYPSSISSPTIGVAMNFFHYKLSPPLFCEFTKECKLSESLFVMYVE